MTTVQYVFDQIAARLESPEFQRTYAQKPQDFSRQRKVGLVSLMSIILNRLVLTTTVELSNFLHHHLPAVTSYTKQSFSEARQKLDPHAFVDLNETLVRHWYAANDYTVIGGRIPVAIDGSTLEIPNTAKLREVYGETGGKQAPGLARAQMSHAYDVANGICLSAVLDRYDASERDLALRNMQAVYGLVPQSLPILWLFDRGYPGLAFCTQIERMGAQFFMRVKESFYLEEFAQVAKDGWLTLVVTKRRAQKLARGHGPASPRDQDHFGQWEPGNFDYQCAGHIAAL